MAELHRVMVVAADGDQVVAGQIGDFLLAQGFEVTLPDAQGRAPGVTMVVLLSPSAVAEPGFVEGLKFAVGARVVPIANGTFASDGIPEALAQLNWLQWDSHRPRRTLDQIAAAIRTNLVEYNTARNVEAAAWAWQAGGRETEGLLTRVGDVESASSRVQAHAALRGSSPDTTVVEFLGQSSVRARRLRRRRRRRMFVWTALGVILSVLVVVLVRTKEQTRQQYLLEFAMLNPSIAQTHAHAQAIKMAYLIGHPDTNDVVRQFAAIQIVSALSESWPTAVVGFDAEWSVNALTPYGDGTRAWVASGSGSLLDYDIEQNRVVTQVLVSDHLYGVAATPDGRTALAADAENVYLIRDGRSEPLDVAADVGTGDVVLAIAPDGLAGAVRSTDGALVGLDLTATGADRLHTSTWDEVLDVRPAAAGGAVALARRGDTVYVVDPMDGRIRWQQLLPTGGLEAGAVSPSGAVAYAAGRMLWSSDGIGPLIATGQGTPDAVTAMMLTDGGRIYYSGTAVGTPGYDTALRIPLPAICSDYVYVLGLIQFGDGTVVCQDYGLVSLWPAVRPSPPTSVPSSVPVAAAGRLVEVIGSSDGLVALTVRTADGALSTQRWNTTGARISAAPDATSTPGNAPLRGTVTAWAVAPGGDTAAIGTSFGDVIEFDITGGGTTVLDSRWSAPDHAAVTGLTYDGGGLQVGTVTATWTVASCAGCGADPEVARQAVLDRQLPCYPSNLDNVIPEDARDGMGIGLCTGSGL